MADLGKELEDTIWRIAGWKCITKIMFGTSNRASSSKKRSEVGSYKFVSPGVHPNSVVLRGYDRLVTRDIYVYFDCEDSLASFVNAHQRLTFEKRTDITTAFEKEVGPIDDLPRAQRRAVHSVLRKVKG